MFVLNTFIILNKLTVITLLNMGLLGVTGSPTELWKDTTSSFYERDKFCYCKYKHINIQMFLISLDLCNTSTHSLLLLDYTFLSLLN